MLATMPLMATEQILKGRLVGGFSELFTVLKSGEFVPNAEQLSANECLPATTARAAEVLETPAQMWDTMREMLRAPGVTDAVQHAMALRCEQSAVSTPAQLSQTETIFSGVLPLHQTNWWEIAIQFLLPGKMANATNGKDATSG